MFCSFVKYYFLIETSKISLLRFILEGYDGLAVLSTIDVRNGLVRLLIPETRIVEFWRLMSSLSHDLRRKGIIDRINVNALS